jgi:ankyrin repeat protein
MTLADHIRKKDLISAAKLIKHDDGINARNSKGESGLHAALETGTTDIFLVLISKGAEMHPDLPHDRNALHVAVDKGHLHLAKAILSNHR